MAGDFASLRMVRAASIEVAPPRGDGAGTRIAVLRRDLETRRWVAVAEPPAAASRPAPDAGLRVTGLPPGSYRLVGLAPGGKVLDEAIVLGPGERHVAADGWRRGATFSGRVLDEAGKPIPGARLSVRDLPLAGASSDAAGRFALHGLPAGEFLWRIELEARGFQRKVLWWRPAADGEQRVVDEVLARGTTREVICTDAAGTGIPGALLLAFARRENGSLEPASCAAARTGADGRGTLTGLPPGSQALVVLAAAAGSALVRELGGGEDLAAPLAVALPEPATIELTLAGPAGIGPVAGARVRLIPRDPVAGIERLAKELFTDRRGRVRFDGVRPGDLDLLAESPPLAPMSRALLLQAGERVALAETMEPGSLVRGIVVDEDGRPVAGAIVILGQLGVHDGVGEQTRATDRHGGFVFDGLPEGLFRLFASRVRGGITESCLLRPVEPGPEQVRMRLVPEDPRAGR
jgi:protocatechuate 3,4-dioxygenase beta subunit